MAGVLLDTTIFIAAERARLSLDDVLADDDEPATAGVTVAELLLGAALGAEARRPGRMAFVDRILPIAPLVPYDLAVARAHADLLAFTRRSGTPRGALDLIIAATARATDRVVLTLDRRGFEGLPGVRVRAPG